MTWKGNFFVYGTLKRGYGNNVILRSSKFLGEAVSRDRYMLLHSGFPMAVRDSEGRPVKGELFEVSDSRVVESLDALEGNGHFYTRHLRSFIDAEGAEVEAWIYEIPRSEMRYSRTLCPVVDGNYEWSR
jgi:gamma-glutamylaminecyclotransferase